MAGIEGENSRKWRLGRNRVHRTLGQADHLVDFGFYSSGNGDTENSR